MGERRREMKLELKREEIEYPNGLEIAVEGFAGDIADVKPSQVFLEVHEGKLKVYVWTTLDEDPTISVEVQPLPPPGCIDLEQPPGSSCHT